MDRSKTKYKVQRQQVLVFIEAYFDIFDPYKRMVIRRSSAGVQQTEGLQNPYPQGLKGIFSKANMMKRP
jgi:hypothetical protein